MIIIKKGKWLFSGPTLIKVEERKDSLLSDLMKKFEVEDKHRAITIHKVLIEEEPNGVTATYYYTIHSL